MNACVDLPAAREWARTLTGDDQAWAICLIEALEHREVPWTEREIQRRLVQCAADTAQRSVEARQSLIEHTWHPASCPACANLTRADP